MTMQPFPEFVPAPPYWPKNLDIMRRWALYVGSDAAVSLTVGALHGIWPAKSWWIGVNSYTGDPEMEPCGVLYVPLNLYADTLRALADGSSHRAHRSLQYHLDFRLSKVETRWLQR
jgi:hypothetical protein